MFEGFRGLESLNSLNVFCSSWLEVVSQPSFRSKSALDCQKLVFEVRACKNSYQSKMQTTLDHNFGCGASIELWARIITYHSDVDHWSGFELPESLISGVRFWHGFAGQITNDLVVVWSSLWEVNRGRLDCLGPQSSWNSLGRSLLSWSLINWTRLIEITALTGYSDAFSVNGSILVRSMNVTLRSSRCLRASEGLNHPSLSMFSAHLDLKLYPSEFQLESGPQLLEIFVWNSNLQKFGPPKNVNLSGP